LFLGVSIVGFPVAACVAACGVGDTAFPVSFIEVGDDRFVFVTYSIFYTIACV
jgi:hypothetical protein